jgi:hypothetical protein
MKDCTVADIMCIFSANCNGRFLSCAFISVHATSQEVGDETSISADKFVRKRLMCKTKVPVQ